MHIADLHDATREPEPFAACRDDTPRLLRIGELKLIAGFLTPEEQRDLENSVVNTEISWYGFRRDRAYP